MALKSIDDVRAIAVDMVESDDAKRKLAQAEEADNMFNMLWELPDDMQKFRWMEASVNPGPHNAVMQGARIYSKIQPKVRIEPDSTDKNTRMMMSAVERWLELQLKGQSRRTVGNWLNDLLIAAFLYGELTSYVNYLPMYFDSLNTIGKDAPRRKEMLKYSDFVIQSFHPESAFVRYSSHLPEVTLTRRVLLAVNLLDEWGNRANNFKKTMGLDENKSNIYATEWSLTDRDGRYVWAGLGENTMPQSPEGGTMILKEEHGLDFYPWAATIGGVGITRDGDIRRTPLLHTMIQTGSWDEQNTAMSIRRSEARLMGSRPRYAIIGGDGSFRIEYFMPDKPLFLDDETVQVVPLPYSDPSPEPALIEREIDLQHELATVSNILRGLSPEPNVAFSSQNLASKSALKVLDPGVEITQDHLVRQCEIMLEWMKWDGKSLIVPGHEVGEILPDAIPVGAEMQVVLEPDMPTDKSELVNQAVMMRRDLGMSLFAALEFLGEPDPDKVIKEGIKDTLREADLQALVEHRQQRSLLQMQTEVAGLQQLGNLVAANHPVAIQILQQVEIMLAQAAQSGQVPAQLQTQVGAQQGGGNGRTPPNPENLVEQPIDEALSGEGFDANQGGAPTEPFTGGLTDEEGNQV